MEKFDNNELIKSLVFPIICVLWGLARVVPGVFTGADFAELFNSLAVVETVICLSAILAGGVVSAILTMTKRVHTEQFLRERLLTVLAVAAVGMIFNIAPFIINFYSLGMAIANGYAVFVRIKKISSTPLFPIERAVLIMSEPIFYWEIFFIWSLILEGISKYL